MRSGLRDRSLALFRRALFQPALFQQTVNFDFASGADIHATICDQRDDEAGGQRGAIPRAVLFGRINRLAELGGVECIADGWAIIGPFHTLVEITQTMAFFLPSTEIAGVAPGFSNFRLEDAMAVSCPFLMA